MRLPETTEEILALHKKHVFFSWAAQASVNPIAMSHAKGVHFWDVDGKRYIDFASQLMNVNIGHQHPKVIAAIRQQTEELCFAYPGMATKVKAALGKRLAEITPGDLSKSFFTLGGAEAIENAMKIAKLVTGRSKIVTRYRSYHGGTMGAASAGGDPRRLAVEPGIPGIVRVFGPYPYRCPWGTESPEACGEAAARHLEQVIQFEGPENVAAVLMEGVTGSSGLLIPPKNYWPRVREICDKYGILIIADEVMSGFGRTGQWFGIDNYGVVPDMITIAKGLTCGYVPLGAVVVSERLARHFDDNTLWCGLTYSGHPVGCAAALACIEIYEEEGLIGRAREMGAKQLACLERLKATHPCVGDVRSIGLFGVIECVKNRETKEPMAPWNAKADQMGAMADVAKSLREQGLSTFVRWNWIFCVPPLTITESELEEGFAMIDRALAFADRAVESRIHRPDERSGTV